jgi:hypothetical protein
MIYDSPVSKLAKSKTPITPSKLVGSNCCNHILVKQAKNSHFSIFL